MISLPCRINLRDDNELLHPLETVGAPLITDFCISFIDACTMGAEKVLSEIF